MEIFKLFGSIMVDNTAANESISKTDEKAEGLGNKFLSGIGTAAKWGAGIATAGVAAVGGMVALANKTGEAADEIDKLSERTGINREELQRWKYAAGQSGADVGKLEVGMKKLSETMVSASEGGAKSTDAFAKLGISMDQVNSSSPSDMFNLVMTQLAEMPDSAERNAIGNQMLGKSYTNMLPLLNAGADGMTDLKNRADDLGLVMSEEMVVANVVFGDTLADIKMSFGAVGMHLSNQFLPILQRFADLILEYMPQIQTVLGFIFNLIGTVAQTAMQGIEALITSFQSLFETSGEGATGFGAAIQTLWDLVQPIMASLQELFNTVLTAILGFWKENGDGILAVVIAAWGMISLAIETALKLIQGVINMILGLIKGDWNLAWDGFKQYVGAVFKAIADGLPAMFELIWAVIRGTFSTFLSLGESIFQNVWDGMTNIWNKLESWVSKKVDWLINKLAFWRSSQDEMGGGSGGGSRTDGSHANGLSYVPFDGYVAELHQGERVLTKKENENYKKDNPPTGDINNYYIDKVYNAEGRDIKDLAEELEYYKKRKKVD